MQVIKPRKPLSEHLLVGIILCGALVFPGRVLSGAPEADSNLVPGMNLRYGSIKHSIDF
ncbi:hypothetical protein HMPREF0293_1943 [Corynebacterium glucuronolyticum ATCC 51866]|uniref:Uncharacterized protein n=1 Tax=Corynebacterium glucuronolyticum ATCC 51866 TaxID=548478 RepID=A0ABP2DT25_9CORY|nr:hypothetical protein HMPREF0293_1943 [Corynebacterium glucuronolyticum ATCC 51866]